MHALDGITRTLRPGGVLLELHPLPRGPEIEIRHTGSAAVLGRLADPDGNARIRAVRRVLRDRLRDGQLRQAGQRWFDWELGHRSVDAWLERRRDYGATSVIPPGLLPRARRAMRPGRVLIVRSRARGTTFRAG